MGSYTNVGENVFATLLIDCRQQMLPMVNEVHGLNYAGEEELQQYL
ncbi:MAG: hypothetical protein IKK59_04270 [Lachnospiraceae bacterium]|nr:hypothetical protein [Lachnospiraceae bacterium]